MRSIGAHFRRKGREGSFGGAFGLVAAAQLLDAEVPLIARA